MQQAAPSFPAPSDANTGQPAKYKNTKTKPATKKLKTDSSQAKDPATWYYLFQPQTSYLLRPLETLQQIVVLLESTCWDLLGAILRSPWLFFSGWGFSPTPSRNSYHLNRGFWTFGPVASGDLRARSYAAEFPAPSSAQNEPCSAGEECRRRFQLSVAPVKRRITA